MKKALVPERYSRLRELEKELGVAVHPAITSDLPLGQLAQRIGALEILLEHRRSLSKSTKPK